MSHSLFCFVLKFIHVSMKPKASKQINGTLILLYCKWKKKFPCHCSARAFWCWAPTPEKDWLCPFSSQSRWWPMIPISTYVQYGPLIASTYEPKILANRTRSQWASSSIDLESKNISREVKLPRYYDQSPREFIRTGPAKNWVVYHRIRAEFGPSYFWTKPAWAQPSWHRDYAGWETRTSYTCATPPSYSISISTPLKRSPTNSWS